MGKFDPKYFTENLKNNMSEEPYVLFAGREFDYKSDAGRRIMKLPWSCVVTSIREDEFLSGFYSEYRLCKEILDEDKLQQRIFEKRNLSIIRLFSTKIQYPSNGDFNPRLKDKARAERMLNALLSLMRFSGKVIVAGYGENDYLEYESFLKFMSIARVSSIYFFGTSNNNIDDDFKEIIIEKKIVIDEHNFESYFLNADDEEIEKYYLDESANAERIYIDGNLMSVERRELFEIKRIAIPLTLEEVNAKQVPRFMVDKYFYMFLKESSFQPQWYGYKEKFNLVRTYEKGLYKEAIKVLERPGNINNKPICLEGQSGAGKSIALANLAYRVFFEKKFPVIFIQNKDSAFVFSDMLSQTPTINGYNSISNYLDTLKKIGTKSSLIIMDVSAANHKERDRCVRLFEMLNTGRGHNIQLVFSSYEVEETEKKQASCNYIKASTRLSDTDDECTQLRKILSRKARLSDDEVESIVKCIYDDNGYNANFMALLYSVFYDVRPSLELGIHREAFRTIDEVLERIRKQNNDKIIYESRIAEAFAMAFVENRGNYLKNGWNDGKGYILKDDIKKLLTAVSICTKYNLPLPSDMAYRMFPTTDYQTIRGISHVPLFVFQEKIETGDFEFWIRSKIEADILLSALNISEEDIVDCVSDMIRDLKCSDSYGYFFEVDMMAKLLHNIGPNADDWDDRKKYRRYYKKIIDALKELRENYGGNPRLTLQEIVYIREYDSYGGEETCIRDAITIGEKELIKLPLQAQTRIRDMLTIEVNNSRLKICRDDSIKGIILCKQIQREGMEVISHDPANSYAYSPVMRAALIEYELLEDDDEKVKLLAQYSEIIDRIRGEHSEIAEQPEMMDILGELSEKIGSVELNEGYFKRLLIKGSDAGIYFQVKKELNKVGINLYRKQEIVLNDQQIEQAKIIRRTYFENDEYEKIVMFSDKCQQILLRLTWLIYDREPIFCGDKRCTHITEDGWKNLARICDNYIKNIYREDGDYYSANTMLYVRALSLAQLGDYNNAIKQMDDISRKTDRYYFYKRSWVKHILCDDKGKPLNFGGKFAPGTDSDKAQGYILLDKISTINSLAGKRGLYYNRTNLLHNTHICEGQYYSDFQLGMGLRGLSVLRGFKNTRNY